ncbi:glycosyltransferase [Sulfuracidifex tepidarius]|nr:glycosyltransferase [Sulfuracidifex tepidarius]
MPKRALFIEEFTRLGGGQIAFVNVYNALKERFNTISLYTDRDHPRLPPLHFDKVIEGGYSYSEDDPIYKVGFRILRERRRLSKVKEEFTFNNHPNVFVYNATLNFVHENFLTPFMDEHGNLKKKFMVYALKASKLYKVYDRANIVVAGEYSKSVVNKSLSILGVKPKRIAVVNLPVEQPRDVDLEGKEGLVLLFGRINREKRLEVGLEVARRSTQKFIIAGSVNRGDETYLEFLKAHAPPNVNIIPNPTIEEKDALFRKASVFLQTKLLEHYGLAVAEAVSYGLVP